MSENLKDDELRIIPPAVDNAQNEHVEPLIGTEHTPHMAHSVSSDPKESTLPSSGAAIPMHPTPHRNAPRARRMSLPLTRVDAWSVAEVTFVLSTAVATIRIATSAVIWVLLDMVGVFNQIMQIVSSTGLDAGGFGPKNVLSLTTVTSDITTFSIVRMVILTLLATITALIYNMVSSLIGGVRVTLGDD